MTQGRDGGKGGDAFLTDSNLSPPDGGFDLDDAGRDEVRFPAPTVWLRHANGIAADQFRLLTVDQNNRCALIPACLDGVSRVTDPAWCTQRRLLEVELEAVGIRLNKKKPDGAWPQTGLPCV